MDKNRGSLKDLIGHFAANLGQYMGGGYDEAKVRADFINKFFALLDWDIHNTKGYAEQYREVIRFKSD